MGLPQDYQTNFNLYFRYRLVGVGNAIGFVGAVGNRTLAVAQEAKMRSRSYQLLLQQGRDGQAEGIKRSNSQQQFRES